MIYFHKGFASIVYFYNRLFFTGISVPVYLHHICANATLPTLSPLSDLSLFNASVFRRLTPGTPMPSPPAYNYICVHLCLSVAKLFPPPPVSARSFSVLSASALQ